MPGNDQLPFLADAKKYKNPLRSIKLWTGILGKQGEMVRIVPAQKLRMCCWLMCR